MFDRPIALALEWWLGEQDKFNDAKISTKYNTKIQKYELTKWDVPGVDRPTDPEIEQIVTDYEAQYVPPKTMREELDELTARVEALEAVD